MSSVEVFWGARNISNYKHYHFISIIKEDFWRFQSGRCIGMCKEIENDEETFAREIHFRMIAAYREVGPPQIDDRHAGHPGDPPTWLDKSCQTPAFDTSRRQLVHPSEFFGFDMDYARWLYSLYYLSSFSLHHFKGRAYSPSKRVLHWLYSVHVMIWEWIHGVWSLVTLSTPVFLCDIKNTHLHSYLSTFGQRCSPDSSYVRKFTNSLQITPRDGSIQKFVHLHWCRYSNRTRTHMRRCSSIRASIVMELDLENIFPLTVGKIVTPSRSLAGRARLSFDSISRWASYWASNHCWLSLLAITFAITQGLRYRSNGTKPSLDPTALPVVSWLFSALRVLFIPQ